MALTENTRIISKEIREDGIIAIKYLFEVFKDGKLIAKKKHLLILEPGVDISENDQDVQDFCNLNWTTEIIEAYQAQFIDQEEE